MKQMLERGLSETREMWEPLRRAYRWVWAAARVLANDEHKEVEEVRAAYVRVLRSIGVTKRHCGALEAALTHFLKVTRSYRSGLFHCYEDAAVPRTNNEMEQCFGQHRHHERRASGRKKGSLNTVLHGTVRLVAGVATRLRQFSAAELAPCNRERWQQLRKAIRERFALRAQGQRFRRDPDAYLAQLEDAYFKPALPV
jgi:hypothetical protein